MNEDTVSPNKDAADQEETLPLSSRQSPESQTHNTENPGLSQEQDEETLDLTGSGSPPPEPKLADVETRRDYVRLVVTIGLLSILAFVVVWSCIETSSWPDHWEHTKEMLQIILPALTGLIGSVLGFYFGADGKPGGQSSS
jgi:hypothetical protein